MKIVFDLTPVYDHLTGIERYNINITREILKSHPENQYVLLFKNKVHESFMDDVKRENVESIIIPGCNKLFFIQWSLFKILQSIKADYYIFLSFTSPVLFKKQKIINAIHDLTCWDCSESMPTKMKYYYRYTYKVATKRSWKIVTVSKYSQRRICEKYRLPENKVPVIYDGLTDIFSARPYENPDLKEKYNLPKQYILSLSTIEPRKNLQLLIRTYQDMINKGTNLPDLVLAGREGWKLEDVVGSITETVKKRIHFTGFIADEDLAQVYREAELFVFPSKYEGFGLPIIEAMSQGTLVVCSDAASLPEVAANAGIIFSSNNQESLTKAIMRGLTLEEEELNKRIQDGIAISKGYSWEREAEKLYRIMDEK